MAFCLVELFLIQLGHSSVSKQHCTGCLEVMEQHGCTASLVGKFSLKPGLCCFVPCGAAVAAHTRSTVAIDGWEDHWYCFSIWSASFLVSVSLQQNICL